MPTIKEYFQNIATSIKQKNSEIVTVTPAQMPQAILDIPSGGGGLQVVTPLHENITTGYTSNGSYAWIYSPNNNYLCDVYETELDHTYILTVGNINYSNKHLPKFLPNDPATHFSNMNGITFVNGNNSNWYFVGKDKCANASYKYLTIYKSDNGKTNAKTYLIDVTELE